VLNLAFSYSFLIRMFDRGLGHSAKNSLVGSIGMYHRYELGNIHPISMAYKMYQLFQEAFIILKLSAYVVWLVGCHGYSASLCYIALLKL
jgi:hypothetical protein